MKTLIDRAIEKCGSVKVLAEHLGVAANVVSMMRHGRTITPETAAELAVVLGEDAGDAAVAVIMEKAKKAKNKKHLYDALFFSVMRKQEDRKIVYFSGTIKSGKTGQSAFYPSRISPQVGPLFANDKTQIAENYEI